MRNLSKNINNAISEFQSFIYCFHITLQDETNIYLTESDKFIKLGSIIFAPYSGLSLKEGEFNDSSQNYIVLEGIFEKNGIEAQTDLTTATIKILMLFGDVSHHFITYSCITHNKTDLGFNICLQPATESYKKSIIQSFSKTCRANFGDLKCKADKNAYGYMYNIKEIFNNTLIVFEMQKEDGYFNCGNATFEREPLQPVLHIKIVTQSGGQVTLDKVITDNMKHFKKVKLIAGCDKNFTTCCNKFDNAINFRGEPFIPENNFIKI